MATSTRFGIELWPSDTDFFSRTQMHQSHERIEERGAIFRQDTFANRGLATFWTRSFFYDTTNGVLYFSDGTNWKEISKYGTTTVKITPGNAAAAGTSADVSRADHVHEVDPYGGDGDIAAIGTTASGGNDTLNKYARANHVHTIGAGSVTAGALAANSINSSAAFVANVVQNNAIGPNAVTKGKISVDQQIPAGVIMPYVGATAPDGWLLCDGTSYPKTTHPDLWTALNGQGYGSTSTNFNVPDLRDRIPRGAATTGATLGVAAGADAFTMSEGQIADHTHAVGSLVVTNGAHSHVLLDTTFASNIDLNHRHTISHTHGGALTSAGVNGGTGFGTSFLSPGPGTGAHASGQAPNGGQYDIVTRIPTVANTAVTTTSQSTSQSGYTNLTEHAHVINTVTHNNSAYSSTISGETAVNNTTNSPIDIRPKTLTVNYIIKT
jgi:microcystin-dependent protein